MKGAESRLRSFPPPWSKKQRQCGRDFRGNVHKQSPTFQAGALIELSGDVDTAFEIYYETYDIHELLASSAIPSEEYMNRLNPIPRGVRIPTGKGD